jgi:hypothetical protein
MVGPTGASPCPARQSGEHPKRRMVRRCAKRPGAAARYEGTDRGQLRNSDRGLGAQRRRGHPRCAQSVPRRATTSREAVDAATHLGLITWTYRHRGNPTRPCGCFAAALHTSGRRFDTVHAHNHSGRAKNSNAMPSGSRKLSPDPYGASTMPPCSTPRPSRRSAQPCNSARLAQPKAT